MWLDRGLVTKHVKMQPMIIRALFLPSHIRNGSGSGGAFFLGFMPDVSARCVVSPSSTLTHPFQLRDEEDPKELNSRETEERAQLKREVYHEIESKIFARCNRYADKGYIVNCADGHTRVGHPGIHVLSLDAQEAAACNCTKAANASHPCPKPCLIGPAPSPFCDD